MNGIGLEGSVPILTSLCEMTPVDAWSRNWSSRLGSNSDDSVRHWTKAGNGLF